MNKQYRLLMMLLMVLALLFLCSCNSSSEKEYAEGSEKVFPAAIEYYNNKYNANSVVEMDSIRTWDMMTLDTSELWYKATDEDGGEYKIVYDVGEERFYDTRQTNEIQLALQEYYYESMKDSGLEVIYSGVYIDGKKCGTNGNWSVFSTFYDGDMKSFLENEPNLHIRAGQIIYIADSAELDGSLKEKEEVAAREGTGTLVESNHGFEEGVEKLCNILESFGNVENTSISVISSETAAHIEDNNKFILPFREGCEYFVEFYSIQYYDETSYYRREYCQDKIYLNKDIFAGVYLDRYQLREGDIVIEELTASSDSLTKWKTSSNFPREDCYIYKITPGDNLLEYLKEIGWSNIQIKFKYPEETEFYKIQSDGNYIYKVSGHEDYNACSGDLTEYEYIIIMIPK